MPTFPFYPLCTHAHTHMHEHRHIPEPYTHPLFTQDIYSKQTHTLDIRKHIWTPYTQTQHTDTYNNWIHIIHIYPYHTQQTLLHIYTRHTQTHAHTRTQHTRKHSNTPHIPNKYAHLPHLLSRTRSNTHKYAHTLYTQTYTRHRHYTLTCIHTPDTHKISHKYIHTTNTHTLNTHDIPPTHKYIHTRDIYLHTHESVNWNMTNAFFVKGTDALVAKSLMDKHDTGLWK